MKRKLKMEVKREKILLEIILNSTLVLTEIMKKKSEKKRVIWVKDWLKRREEKGVCKNIISELRLVDLSYCRIYIRLNPETFNLSHYYHLSGNINPSTQTI